MQVLFQGFVFSQVSRSSCAYMTLLIIITDHMPPPARKKMDAKEDKPSVRETVHDEVSPVQTNGTVTPIW